MDAIYSSGLALTGNMENVLTEAVEAVNTNEMYTTKAFEGGTDARSKLGYSMIDLATADRATVESVSQQARVRKRPGGIPDRCVF